GMGSAAKDVDIPAGEREMLRTVAIIDSMTSAERRDPSVLNGSRRKRLARARVHSGPQGEPAQAHRPGQRHRGGRRQPPAETVRAGAQAHETTGEWRGKREQGPRGGAAPQ